MRAILSRAMGLLLAIAGVSAPVVALLAGMALSSCSSKPMTSEAQFHRLFDGFQSVLETDAPAEIWIGGTDVPNLATTLPLDDHLQAGRIYLLVATAPTSWESMALKEFPRRLNSIGARITMAPKSSEDLTHLYVGGPIFSIEFDLSGHHGKLFNWFGGLDERGKPREKLVLEYK